MAKHAVAKIWDHKIEPYTIRDNGVGGVGLHAIKWFSYSSPPPPQTTAFVVARF